MNQAKRVFISYSHDSAEYMRQVLALSERLRKTGINAWIDQYEDFPVFGWPHWMKTEIRKADFVLVLCTKAYMQRFERIEERGTGKGVKWEGAIITNELYEAECENRKFVPCVLETQNVEFIPTELRPYTHFDVSRPSAYESLYRLITGQQRVVPSPVGGIARLPQQMSEYGGSTIGLRLNATLSVSTSTAGWVPIITLANISTTRLFLENPVLKLVQNHEDAPLLSRSGAVSEYTMLPIDPASGPLEPTEQRSYFLDVDSLRLIQNDAEFFGCSTPTVEIRTGAGTELVLDDTNSSTTLQAILGFPKKVEDGCEEARMPVVMQLLHRQLDLLRPFRIFPPQEVVDCPSVLESDDIVARLHDKRFEVVLNDGQSELLSLRELLIFVQHLIFLGTELEKMQGTAQRAGVSEFSGKITLHQNARVTISATVLRAMFKRVSMEEVSYLARNSS